MILKVLFIFLITLILVGCKQENKSTVITHMVPKYQVDLNNASKAELEDMLVGVGPAIASKIVASRNSKPFESIYDLRERNIIGKDLFTNIKGDIKIGTTTNKYSRSIADVKQ